MKRLLYKDMKKRIFKSKLRNTIAVFLMGIAFMLPCNVRAEDIFSELTDLKQVESTYISGRFSHNKRSWQSHSGLRAVNLSNGFSSLYTYRCYSTESVDKARSILKAYLKKHPDMEVVMRTKELAGEYVIYEQFNSEDKLMKMIIWNAEAPNLCEIVVVDWKDGLVGNTSSNQVDFWGNPARYNLDFSIDLSGLTGLLELQDLEQLEQLKQLGKLENFKLELAE